MPPASYRVAAAPSMFARGARPADVAEAKAVPQLAHAAAPQARDPHSRHEPCQQDKDERRDRHAVDQQRQSESSKQHETEDDVRTSDDDEHEFVHRITDRVDERWSRETKQRTP